MFYNFQIFIKKDIYTSSFPLNFSPYLIFDLLILNFGRSFHQNKEFFICFKIAFVDLDYFKKAYVNSKEEIADLKQAYINNRGDMDLIYEYVIFSLIFVIDLFLLH
jgi:hypothetical protein